MFLHLNHQKLDIYQFSLSFVIECYKLTKHLPSEEKFGLVAQIRRAAVSVHLNISEGSSRTSSAERKRYFEIARGSVIEIDAAVDVALGLNYLDGFDAGPLGDLLVRCFKIITGLMKAC
jgi:four helix bundle protein